MAKGVDAIRAERKSRPTFEHVPGGTMIFVSHRELLVLDGVLDEWLTANGDRIKAHEWAAWKLWDVAMRVRVVATLRGAEPRDAEPLGPPDPSLEHPQPGPTDRVLPGL